MGDVERRRRIWRRHHWTMIAVCAAIVALSFALRVRSDQRVELRVLPGHAFPETCLSRSVWDTECPGCGLTRSFVLLAETDWRESFARHRLGWLFALVVLWQFPYRVFSLRRLGRTTGPPPLAPKAVRIGSQVLIVALIGNWLLRLAGV